MRSLVIQARVLFPRATKASLVGANTVFRPGAERRGARPAAQEQEQEEEEDTGQMCVVIDSFVCMRYKKVERCNIVRGMKRKRWHAIAHIKKKRKQCHTKTHEEEEKKKLTLGSNRDQDGKLRQRFSTLQNVAGVGGRGSSQSSNSAQNNAN